MADKYTSQNIGYNPNWTERQRVEPTFAQPYGSPLWQQNQADYQRALDEQARMPAAWEQYDAGRGATQLPSLPGATPVKTSTVYEDPAAVAAAYGSPGLNMMGYNTPAYSSGLGLFSASPQMYGVQKASPQVASKQASSLAQRATAALGAGIDGPVYSRQGSNLPSGYIDIGNGLAIDPDGKVVASTGFGGGYGAGSALGYAAAPDLSFSRSAPSRAITSGGGLPSGYADLGNGLAIDPDGKVVASTGFGGGSSGGSSGSAPTGLCYLTTAAVEGHEADDGPTLSGLRWFRDAIMGGKHAEEVAEYYRTAPGVVAWIEAHPKRDRIYRLIRTRVLRRCLRHIERFEFDKCRLLYKRMVKFLEARAHV